MASTTLPTRALTAVLFTLLAWAATPLTTQAQLPDYLPTDGLVGWWPFNGNANDESGNGNDGTVNGAILTEDRDGNPNAAYSFDGENDSVVLPNSLELNDVDGGVTLSLWFNAISLSGTSYLIDLTDGNSNNTWNDRIVLSLNNGNYSTGGHFDNNIQLAYSIINEPTANQSPFLWRNYCVVYNWESSIISQYVDGVLLEYQGALEESLNIFLSGGNDGSRKIGARAHSQDPILHWHGTIDDIAIYNRALTPEEITALYTGIPYVAPCADPTACNFEQEGECVYAEPNLDCAGNCLNDFNNNGVCDEVEVYGCEYPTACNYNPEANVGDGSCAFPEFGYDCAGNCLLDLNNNGLCDLEEVAGCTNIDAINYDADATLDDGSCMVTCKGDFDNDGQITINDLLGFLAAYGNQCEGAGCMDPAGCNYDPTATFDLGYCEYPAEFFNCDGTCINDADGDGICDELEVPGCTDPEAGNYNPDATDDDGSCAAAQPQYPAGSVFCNGTPTEVVEVLNPATGRIWMDRNLGASQAATSSTDAAAYGDLYQWGRGADGHQCRNSGITNVLSSTDQPGHGDFIVPTVSIMDWRSPQNDFLWQGVTGINNPCPAGFRLPSYAELDAERLSWSVNNTEGAYNSLKLTMAGYRRDDDGGIDGVGFNGFYWSYTSVQPLYFYFMGGTMNIGLTRAFAVSVRCIKD